MFRASLLTTEALGYTHFTGEEARGEEELAPGHRLESGGGGDSRRVKNLHRSRLSTTSARPRECPRAGSSGRLQRPGNTQRSGPNPPGGREVPAGWHTAGRASWGPEGGQVSVPRPPLTPQPRRQRSSERPGPPRLTRLAATPGERKRYSPAKTLHPKAGGQGAGAGTAPGGEGSAPSTPDPARPTPTARRPMRMRRPAWTGPFSGAVEGGRASPRRRGRA